MIPKIYFYNTLSRKKELFKPLVKGKVGVYSCGPTVYWNQHIGNMYAFLQWDLLVRSLKYFNFDVKWVMNITDVGHMTGDNVGAADTGEDRMEKRAKIEKISVWEIADKYIAQFLDSIDKLNISRPNVLCRATENINAQIELIKIIEEKGFTYKTEMGLVFDTSKFADYSKFARLDLDKQIKREDVADDPEKKSLWDFFLWVTGRKDHVMQWDSPWGKGYPGWHAECTAMSTKYLSTTFDIHTGGIEHIGIHHTNEIAQGFAAFGKSTANYWLHNGWLLGKKGEKLSKSSGNIVTVQELFENGYNPLAFRYLVLSSHYKKGINFSFESLDSAVTALNSLYDKVAHFKNSIKVDLLSKEKVKKIDGFKISFRNALADDLNVPKALAVVWELVKSSLPAYDKYELLLGFDEVLGLNFKNATFVEAEVPENVHKLAQQRENYRKQGDFDKADMIRKKVNEQGYDIKDKSDGFVIVTRE